jgi:hypothetical protein
LAIRQRRGRRGQHAAEQDLAARGADARGQRGLEHLAGLARVADDEHARAGAADLGRGGPAQGDGQLRGEHLAGDTADAIGPEELASQAR